MLKQNESYVLTDLKYERRTSVRSISAEIKVALRDLGEGVCVTGVSSTPKGTYATVFIPAGEDHDCAVSSTLITNIRDIKRRVEAHASAVMILRGDRVHQAPGPRTPIDYNRYAALAYVHHCVTKRDLTDDVVDQLIDPDTVEALKKAIFNIADAARDGTGFDVDDSTVIAKVFNSGPAFAITQVEVKAFLRYIEEKVTIPDFRTSYGGSYETTTAKLLGYTVRNGKVKVDASAPLWPILDLLHLRKNDEFSMATLDALIAKVDAEREKRRTRKKKNITQDA